MDEYTEMLLSLNALEKFAYRTLYVNRVIDKRTNLLSNHSTVERHMFDTKSQADKFTRGMKLLTKRNIAKQLELCTIAYMINPELLVPPRRLVEESNLFYNMDFTKFGRG